MNNNINIIIDGQDTDKYEFRALVKDDESNELLLLIDSKKPQDEATSNG